jgi:hypothetical protein
LRPKNPLQEGEPAMPDLTVLILIDMFGLHFSTISLALEILTDKNEIPAEQVKQCKK